MKLIFMGTPDFSVPTLNALVAAGHDVVAVFTQPPRPAGRGKKEQKSAVHKAADAHGIPVHTPKSLKTEDQLTLIQSMKADFAVVVAYGQILPQVILNAPKHGCVNVHASLLPRWRGAAPIHRAIMAGDRETGVCIMQMEAGLDTGPVISEARVSIDAGATTAALHDTLAELGAELINPALRGLAAGAITPHPQPDDGITYAHKIDKSEAKIDWTADASIIDQQVRGLFPFPGAWTMMDGERVKILSGNVVEQASSSDAGTAIDNQLTVACGEGLFQINRAQRAGKGAMDREDFLRGFPVPKGSQFT
ncbi:MAG: methionyl-tRNA formyltransferase [Kordiimonadaceae bacterium]|nr:methionyl-tRNA formyltransferase [Kordiimonadaceae bacterium]MBO6568451.1 methionyl-tRNA formyltransferase [Kordiimonadaceae bacterium]MBO6963820.1 methionyl-tRNA formyltransferase [Kordiimonadaceae bacterium]